MRRSVVCSILLLALFSLGYRTGTTTDSISKIYLTGSTLIRTTPGTDIRFYDLSNPAAPQQRGRIDITSNSDVAVMDHFMYADRDRDLIVYDITDVGNPIGVDTIKGAFETPASARWAPVEFVNDETSAGGMGCNGCGRNEAVSAPVPASGGPMVRGASDASGTSGSLARFTISGGYLYCIDDYSLRVFDIKDPARPRYKNNVQVGWQIETIFPYKGNLFIGGRSGMYIYSISDPDDPAPVGEFQHPRRCDPVVVEDNTAYVTLRSGGSCGGNDNQLDILDVSDLKNPRLITSFMLGEPYGLTVRDGIVLVCDGPNGVIAIDATDRNNPKRVGGISGITAHDIILDEKLMIVTAETGFFVYDGTDLRNPKPYGRLDF